MRYALVDHIEFDATLPNDPDWIQMDIVVLY
jgi:hypothetical protein